jgi:hypothetical protein
MEMTRTKVIIINGVQGSGKDTFVKLAQSYCNMNEMANVLNLSSVDPIKDLLDAFGWDGDKTDDVRNIIAGIKKIWIGAQNGPTMFMMNNILEWHKQGHGEDNIVFCHVREPEEIDKLECAISGMESMGIEVMTMLIIRGDSSISERNADNFEIISQYPYDRIIYNDADLASLDEQVCKFIEELLD